MSSMQYDVTVLNAIYASNNKGISVKSTIIDTVLAAGGDLRFTPTNEFFKQDPDPGHTKYCLVVIKFVMNGGAPLYYMFGGQEGSEMEILPDGDMATAEPRPKLEPMAGRHKIHWAIYANGFGGLDASACVQALENTNVKPTNVWVAPTTLGYDFSPNHSKFLFIAYGDESNPQFKAGMDGATLTIS